MVSTWSQSGDGTTTIEQYAKPAADGGQAWLLWARRQDKPVHAVACEAACNPWVIGYAVCSDVRVGLIMTIRLCAASLFLGTSLAALSFPAASQQIFSTEPRQAVEPKIVGVSVPADSSDGPSWSYDASVWRTEFPIRDVKQIGIGYIVEPEPFHRDWSPADFVMHDHMYLANGVPDPRRANITYNFDKPAKISEVLIIQHTNGIGQIEGFIGNDETHLQSLGRANSTLGANLPLKENTFAEGYRDVFKFEKSGEGKVFRIVITRTPLPNGYAVYRAYPRNGDHSPYEALRVE